MFTAERDTVRIAANKTWNSAISMSLLSESESNETLNLEWDTLKPSVGVCRSSNIEGDSVPVALSSTCCVNFACVCLSHSLYVRRWSSVRKAPRAESNSDLSRWSSKAASFLIIVDDSEHDAVDACIARSISFVHWLVATRTYVTPSTHNHVVKWSEERKRKKNASKPCMPPLVSLCARSVDTNEEKRFSRTRTAVFRSNTKQNETHQPILDDRLKSSTKLGLLYQSNDKNETRAWIKNNEIILDKNQRRCWTGNVCRSSHSWAWTRWASSRRAELVWDVVEHWEESPEDTEGENYRTRTLFSHRWTNRLQRQMQCIQSSNMLTWQEQTLTKRCTEWTDGSTQCLQASEDTQNSSLFILQTCRWTFIGISYGNKHQWTNRISMQNYWSHWSPRLRLGWRR